MTEDELSGLFFWGILGLILGARIFSTLVYESSMDYLRAPWLIFWPFRGSQFTGFQGMSYHGGVIGGATAVFIYSWKKGFDFRETADMFCAGIPLGYTFGRLGNFINGELFGRITNGPLGMVFPHGGIHPAGRYYQQILKAASNIGFDVTAGSVLNLPRHPSQLYEALFEGIILWAIIWFWRNRKPFKGFLISLYISGYGLFRFFIEYFREPDSDLGYRIEFIENNLPPALAHPPLSFSTGQILCFAMIVFGIIWAFIAYYMPDSKPVYVYPDKEEAGSQPVDAQTAERNRRRKLRKKLK
jgi:phosphatidylglycerol:prolipoprotein diacylglycerol transferase